MKLAEEQKVIAEFKEVNKVLVNSEKFKIKLGIGSDAYKSLKASNIVAQLWNVGGAAGTGASVAASGPVASTFFGSFWTLLPFTAPAVTPVLLVAGVALASGGAFYGVSRLFRSYSNSRVAEIPKFLNTGLDVLATSIFDLMGSLALKVASIDGQIDQAEKSAIKEYFAEEWGYDRSYLSHALELLVDNVERTRLDDMTAELALFAKNNPDCNFKVMQADITRLLIEIAEADGHLDEREEMAIERIYKSLVEHGSKLGVAGDLISESAAGFGKLMGGASSNLQSKLTNVAVKLSSKKLQ